MNVVAIHTVCARGPYFHFMRVRTCRHSPLRLAVMNVVAIHTVCARGPYFHFMRVRTCRHSPLCPAVLNAGVTRTVNAKSTCIPCISAPMSQTIIGKIIVAMNAVAISDANTKHAGADMRHAIHANARRIAVFTCKRCCVNA
jgi:hypothetical protein